MPMVYSPTVSINIRGKEYILTEDSEVILGLGDHQYLLQLSALTKDIVITNIRTKEKLHVKATDKSSVVQKISSMIKSEVSTKTYHKSDIVEYDLPLSYFNGNDEFEIYSIPRNCTITRIEFLVVEKFTTDIDKQYNIALYDANDSIVFPAEWNDPNMVGNYISSLYHQIGEDHKLKVKHDLINATEGHVVLRIHYNK